MTTWIFQGHPRRYDVADPELFAEGRTEVWLVSRYREQMAVGDIVYLWRAGEASGRGLYGWGTIESEPEYHQDWGWGIPVEYAIRFPRHISADVTQADPVLASHLLFRMPTGTNFAVSREEAAALERLVAEQVGRDYAPEAD